MSGRRYEPLDPAELRAGVESAPLAFGLVGTLEFPGAEHARLGVTSLVLDEDVEFVT